MTTEFWKLIQRAEKGSINGRGTASLKQVGAMEERACFASFCRQRQLVVGLSNRWTLEAHTGGAEAESGRSGEAFRQLR